MAGLRSLNYRIKTCNPYSQLYKNPMTMETEIILSNGDTLTADEIAERLVEKQEPKFGALESQSPEAVTLRRRRNKLLATS